MAKGKGQVLMVFAMVRDDEMTMKLEGEPNLDQMAQQVQNIFKLKNLYDQMVFSPKQKPVITKAVIELTHSSGSSNLLRTGRREAKGSKIIQWCFMRMTSEISRVNIVLWI